MPKRQNDTTTKPTRLGFCVSPELRAEMDAYCDQTGATLTGLFERAVREYLGAEKKVAQGEK